MTQSKTKRYYWIKLFDSMLDSDLYNHIMSLDNGATIFTIYIALLMSVINKKGKFVTVINDIEIIDTVEKIKKELKHFKYEQVLFTLGFLEKFGVLSKDENGAYFFPNYDKLVGSETKDAERKRIARNKQKKQLTSADNVQDNVRKIADNVPYRDKDIKTLRHKDIKTYRDIDTKTTHNIQVNRVCECEEFILIFQKYSFPEIQEKLFVNLVQELHNDYNSEDIKTAITEVLESYQGQRLTNPFRWLKSAVSNKIKEVVNRPQEVIVNQSKVTDEVEIEDDLDDSIWDQIQNL
ncbi:MAG: phage replisome organizer N-terminal domain-containing protein [Bacilli bacterium]